MRTPRLHARSRGIGTLIGNGWLREAPVNRAPGFWNVQSRSALRKCMFMNVPRELLAELPVAEPSRSPRITPTSLPSPRGAFDDLPVKRANPKRDVRMMPAVDPELARRVAREQARGPAPAWDHPIALGVLLMIVPPIGLAALWSSKRYSSDARWALTIMTALMMCLTAAVAITALSLR